MDEPRDRAAVRAGQRRHPHRRRPALGRGDVAGDARASSPPTCSASRSASWARRGSRRGRFGGARLTVTWPALVGGAASAGIGFTVSLLVADARVRRAAARGGEARRAGDGGPLAARSPWLALQVMRRLPAETARAPARRDGRRRSSTSPTTSTPSATTSAAALDAPVTLLEYGDFECPYCGDAAPIIAKLLDHLGDELRYVFRHLPLDRRAPERPAGRRGRRGRGRAGRASGRCTTGCWPHQDELAPPDLVRHAADLGLDSTASRRTCAGAGTPRASPRTSRAPTPAASPARRRSSSTAAATRASTTSTPSRGRSRPPAGRHRRARPRGRGLGLTHQRAVR